MQPAAKEPAKNYVLINGMHFSHSEILKWREQEVAYRDRHADDVAVDTFAQAMKNKMAQMREKGASGWNNESICATEYLARCLIYSITKGDPVDIANFAMMLFNRDDCDLEIKQAMTSLLMGHRQGCATVKVKPPMPYTRTLLLTEPEHTKIMSLIELLGKVAGAACHAADDSGGLAGAEAIVPADLYQALSDALDECDKLPELNDDYVRDGWLRALDTLRLMLKLPEGK